MLNSSQIIKNYSIKYDSKIKKICSPLIDHLNISIFTYSFIDANGRFGFLTNALDFNTYYFEKDLHLQNPYFAHPNLFRSGCTMFPCSLDGKIKKILNNRFEADHFFLNLKTDSQFMEVFIFANPRENLHDSLSYLLRLDLLEKFSRYFKREAKHLIEKMRADQFNIKEEKGSVQFETALEVPLKAYESNTQQFLKKVMGLSRQELVCLEHFKQGKSAQATAAFLNISPRTVESHFENIKNKVGCFSKYDLLNY